MSKLRLLLSALATAWLLNAGLALAADPAMQRGERMGGWIYGSELMDPEELNEHRAKMRAAASAEEREHIRNEHHQQMRVRAEKRGITLPEHPPARKMRHEQCAGAMECMRGPIAGEKAADSAGIAYLSGGIGSDDPVARMAEDYKLHLVFATQGSGAYVADVRVLIEDAKGKKILAADSPGPIFYVKLPTGNYRITAEYEGKPLRKSVSLKDHRLRDLYFHWRGEPVAANEGSR
ncbi:MAG: hypothetical protein WAZ34_01645 [Rhodocyclaceae bacterium]